MYTLGLQAYCLLGAAVIRQLAVFAVTAECISGAYKHVVVYLLVNALVCLMMKKKSNLHTLCLESLSPCILKA